jgi:hypothetical protein
MQDVGENSFQPIDPLSRERIRQSQFEQDSRAKAWGALQRGDMMEYLAQSRMANQSAVDAEGYAQLAGVTTPDGLVVADVQRRNTVPPFSPAPVQPANASPGGIGATPAAPSLPNAAIGPDTPPVNASSGIAAPSRNQPLIQSRLPTTAPGDSPGWPRFASITRPPLQASVSPWS